MTETQTVVFNALSEAQLKVLEAISTNDLGLTDKQIHSLSHLLCNTLGELQPEA